MVVQALEQEFGTGRPHPLFRWLTNDQLFAAMRQQRPDVESWGSEGSFRARWEPHEAFIRDLVRWLRVRQMRPTYPRRSPGRIREAFESSESASKLIRRIGRANLDYLFGTPLFRLQVFSAIVSPPEPPVESNTGFYLEVEKRWLPIIARIFKTYEFRLRPGVTQRDLLTILTAVGEGLALREMADPTTGRRRQERVKLQATTALALLIACTSDTAESLDDAVDRLVAQRRSQGL